MKTKEEQIKEFNQKLSGETWIHDSHEQVMAYERLKKIIPEYAYYGEREKYIVMICDKIGM